MQATIQKWGNSQGIRNDIVELEKSGDSIVIKKVTKESRLDLDEIFKDYDGESMADEFDWGSPAGKEVW